MEVSELIKKYLKDGRVMQLATVRGDQPWVCSVHYVSDAELNIYWLSWPSRRHSKDISLQNKAAITVVVKGDQPVIGLQAEGIASAVTEPEQIARLMKLYVKRYNTGQDFYNNFVSGKNKHVMYRLKPTRFSLFDELNFPKDSGQNWIPHITTQSRS